MKVYIFGSMIQQRLGPFLFISDPKMSAMLSRNCALISCKCGSIYTQDVFRCFAIHDSLVVKAMLPGFCKLMICGFYHVPNTPNYLFLQSLSDTVYK